MILDKPWVVVFGILLLTISTRSALLVGATFLWIRLSRFAKRRRIYRIDYAKGQLANELKAGLAVIAFDALFVSLLLSLGLFQRSPHAGPWMALVTYGIMFVWIEIWFYASHRLLHTRALYKIHRQHHVANVTDPLTAISFSLGERAVLLVGVSGFAVGLSYLIPFSFIGFLAVLASTYVFNVLGHSNVEYWPKWFVTSWLGRFFITPTYHSMHHARFRGHYGLFTSVLDRAFGTVFDDYDWVYARAAEGDGLRSLGERQSQEKGPEVSL